MAIPPDRRIITTDAAGNLPVGLDKLANADHGALTGLDEDGHAQYALADGSRGNFAAPAHNHDERYFTETEADGRYARSAGAVPGTVLIGSSSGPQWLSGMGLTASLNLINPNNRTPQSSVSGFPPAIVFNASHDVTDFIPVKPSTQYTGTNLSKVALYRADKSPVSTVSGTGEVNTKPYPTFTFTTGADIAYVRVVITPQFIDIKAALHEGAIGLPPEPWFEGADLTTYNPPKVKAAARARRPVLDIRPSPDFVAATPVPARPTAAPSPADIYAAWDAIQAAYPTEVTRTEVATTAGARKLYQYDIRPPRPPASSRYVPTYPKVLITAGIHGGEFASMWNMVDTFSRIFSDWSTSPHLEMLRWNVDWSIIPLVNPDGLVAVTRKNGNGVDLARNFPEAFSPGVPADVTYGGPTPLSEPEAVAVYAMLKMNADANLYLDHHNYSSSLDPRYVWMAVANAYTSTVAQAHSQGQTRLWRKNRPTLDQSPEVFLADSTGWAPDGSPAVQAAADGIPLTLTYECSQNVGAEASLGTTNQTMAYESMVNFLTRALREASR